MSQQIAPKGGRYLFDGGLNTKFEKSIIGDNESPDCLNVVFENGAVGTREGVSKLNTSLIGSFVCDGLYVRHTNTGGQTMIAFAGGSAWQLAATTFSTIASAQSVFTAGIRVMATEYQQHLFIGNGGIIPYKYNGTDFTRHGVYPPTTTAAVSTGAAGALTGDYQYKVTYVNSQSVESDVGPLTATFTAAAATKISMTAIPTAPQSFGISSRNIYRTVAGGSAFKRVATISDNTTTTYLDNIADAALGVTAPVGHAVPPLYAVVCYHRDRIFCNDPAEPNTVNYSNLEDPYSFPAANFKNFGDNTADIVRALAIDGENLVVFGDRSIEIVYMPSSADVDWQTLKVKCDFGCKSPFGIVRYNNGLLFPATQGGKFIGFAHLVGDAVSPSATFLTVSTAGSNLVSDRIEPDMLTFNTSDIDEISGYILENKAYFGIAYGSAATENNRIYVFDFSISNLSKNTPYAWAPWTGLYPAQFAEYNGSLYYGDGRANGFVYQMNAGIYRDDTTAINSYFKTKEFGGNPGDFNYFKDFRYANILYDLAGNYLMNVTMIVDSDLGSGLTQTIDLNPGGSLWGSMVWGVDLWGGGSAQDETKLDLGTLSGKRIQFKFDNQNTINQRFRVHSLNFSFNPKGQR